MNNLLKIILENIENENNFFVFPTDIAATSWADFILENTEIKAIRKEQFMAWDIFKANSVKSKVATKQSIPGILKKLFVQSLIDENITKTKNHCPIFTSIINPEFVDTSSSFVNWISSLLPQLQSWKDRNVINDDEDKDLLTLYSLYSDFLSKNNLFEAAWQKPPFIQDNKHYFIFYPEILSDFADYQTLLQDAHNNNLITIISCPKTTNQSSSNKKEVNFYSNTRTEIRKLAYSINQLIKDKKTTFNKIAINIPQISDLLPYVTRELDLYDIPYKLRSGKCITEYSEGKLFNLIKTCNDDNFSFQSVASLLTNAHFPWKDKVAINQLIEFALKYHCVCSFDNKDIWQKTFQEHNNEQRAAKYYDSFKQHIKSICNSRSFSDLAFSYSQFRNDLFDSSNFTDSCDRILGTAITELSHIIDIEENYPQVKCNNPFAFFINWINTKEYLPQNANKGVNLFDYKVACVCPFDYHFIIQASQKDITIEYSQLKFLSQEKRNLLNLADSNVSDLFINCYSTSSNKGCQFSASEKCLSGFVIPHNELIKIDYTKEKPDSTDNYYFEKQCIINNKDNCFPKNLFSKQLNGFNSWSKIYLNTTLNELSNSDKINDSNLINTKKIMKEKIYEKLFDTQKQKIRISCSTLTAFFSNPLKWFYDRILKIKEFSMQAKIVDDVFIGTLYHEVIKRILSKYQQSGQPLQLNEKRLSDDFIANIYNEIHEVLIEFPQSCGLSTIISPLTIELIIAKENIYRSKLTMFFLKFLSFFNNFTVYELEKTYFLDTFDSYFLEGKIDCILADENGELTVVDFKLNKLPDIYTDFQLPFYVNLLEQNFSLQNKSINISNALFFSINDLKPSVALGCINNCLTNKTSPMKETDIIQRFSVNSTGISFQTFIDNLQQKIDQFIEIINNDDVTFIDENQVKNKIFSCFDNILEEIK